MRNRIIRLIPVSLVRLYERVCLDTASLEDRLETLGSLLFIGVLFSLVLRYTPDFIQGIAVTDGRADIEVLVSKGFAHLCEPRCDEQNGFLWDTSVRIAIHQFADECVLSRSNPCIQHSQRVRCDVVLIVKHVGQV